MNRCLSTVLFLGLPLFASAQSKPSAVAGFDSNYVGLGPTIGLGGGIGGASIAFGGRFEKAVKVLPDIGGGILGIGLLADYYSYSDNTFGSHVSFGYTLFGGTANYHFKMEDRRWDPFIGLGLGYSTVSVSGGGSTLAANSGIFFIGRGGLRYFYSDKAAVQVDLGTGAATINVGVMWQL